MSVETIHSFQERLAQAVRRLMNVELEGERARLSIPVLYPSGASTTVEITLNGSNCFVSDTGLGHMEAEFQGAERFYGTNARNAAERFGVRFDGFNTLWLPENGRP